ncbi:mandelate racemase [Modestobacter sp. VKM Ac-2676]|nr:mandelate racemase [Modestobacter sp. VKM Ac-2676]
MTPDLRITRLTIRQFAWELPGIGTDASGMNPVYDRDGTGRMTGYVLSIDTAGGVTGEYAWSMGSNPLPAVQIGMVARFLLGRDALDRERIWNDLKRYLRKNDAVGLGPIDIALWDLAGKAFGAPVHRLLGSYRSRLPAYASTYFGDDCGGLDSPAAFADFAVRCRDMGYRGFKIHGWAGGSIAREVESVLATRAAVGDGMALMLDPACTYETFADALTVGRACDEAGYFWYEDPYMDGGSSAFAHRKLRQLIRTPLLLGEHVRGHEAHVDQILGEGTDFVRADPDLDGGITGVLKLAHAAEGFGLDLELHGPGPAHRQCMAAIRNTNFYELGLVTPEVTSKSEHYRVYACDYTDDLDAVDAAGTVPVPDGPGLGVTLDWDWITARETSTAVHE